MREKEGKGRWEGWRVKGKVGEQVKKRERKGSEKDE